MIRPIVWVALVLACAIGFGAPAAETVDMNQRAEDLKQLKWGMFVCWSFSTFSNQEYTPGIKDVTFFKPAGCDTEQWALVAKAAHMGYIVFLTKHHDGFCLWDTQTTERKVTKSPLGEDVLAKVRKSCDKHGLKLALYFSEGEWGGPDKPGGGRLPGDGGYDPEKKKSQLRELLTQYGPIEFFWMDHAVGDGGLGHQQTAEWVKRFQPGCFVGFNSGVPAGDLRLGEMGHASSLEDVSGVGLHAKLMRGYTGFRLAEFTYPIWPDSVPKGTHTHWFYSAVPDTRGTCHTREKIYGDYLGAVKYGNIFSLDVAPDRNGKLRAIDVETLEAVGRMIRQ